MDSAFSHYLAPKIEKMGENEVSSLLSTMACVKEDLPIISISDAGLNGLDVAPGDIVKVHRTYPKKEFYYRLVTAD